MKRHLLDTDSDVDDTFEGIDIELVTTEWQETGNNFTPQLHEFSGDAGIKLDDTGFKEHDYVSQFLDKDVWNLVVGETNRKSDQFFATHKNLSKRSIFPSWYKTNSQEMKKFIGLIFLQGLVKKPCWRQFWLKDSLTFTPSFATLMDRDWYELLMKFSHFSENTSEPLRNSPQLNRLFKTCPLVEHFSTMFSRAFTPYQDICIDESLLLYMGRIFFKQYIPLKQARFGIKLFCLTDKHGYLHSFRMYSRKDNPVANLNAEVPPDCTGMSFNSKTTLVLLKLFLNKGYHLYVDNWYSSVLLLEYLRTQNTTITSTTKANRVPKQLKNTRVPKGESHSVSKGLLLAQKFEDKRTVYICSQQGAVQKLFPRQMGSATHCTKVDWLIQ